MIYETCTTHTCPKAIKRRRVIFTGSCGQCGVEILFRLPEVLTSRAQRRFHAGDQPFTPQELPVLFK